MKKSKFLFLLMAVPFLSQAQSYFNHYPNMNGFKIQDVEIYDGKDHLIFEGAQDGWRNTLPQELDANGDVVTGTGTFTEELGRDITYIEGARFIHLKDEQFGEKRAGYFFTGQNLHEGVEIYDLNDNLVAKPFVWTHYYLNAASSWEIKTVTQLECFDYTANITPPKQSEEAPEGTEAIPDPDPNYNFTTSTCGFEGTDAIGVDEDNDGIYDATIVLGTSLYEPLRPYTTIPGQSFTGIGAQITTADFNTRIALLKINGRGDLVELKEGDGKYYHDHYGNEQTNTTHVRAIKLLKSPNDPNKFYALTSYATRIKKSGPDYNWSAFRILCFDQDLNILWQKSYSVTTPTDPALPPQIPQISFSDIYANGADAAPEVTGFTIDKDENIYVSYKGLHHKYNTAGYNHMNSRTGITKISGASGTEGDWLDMVLLTPKNRETTFEIEDIAAVDEEILICGAIYDEGEPYPFTAVLNPSLSANYAKKYPANKGRLEDAYLFDQSVFLTGKLLNNPNTPALMKLNLPVEEEDLLCFTPFIIDRLSVPTPAILRHDDLKTITVEHKSNFESTQKREHTAESVCCGVTHATSEQIDVCPTYPDFNDPQYAAYPNERVWYDLNLAGSLPPATQYHWTIGDSENGTSYVTATPTLSLREGETLLTGGLVTLVTENEGCYTHHSFTVNFIPPVEVTLTSNPALPTTTPYFNNFFVELCVYDDPQQLNPVIDFDALTSVATFPGVWSLNNGVGAIDPVTGIYTPFVGLAYIDEAEYSFTTDGDGCLHKAKIEIDVNACDPANEGGEARMGRPKHTEEKGSASAITAPGYDLKFFPNPAKTMVNIQVPTGTIQSIKIYDLTGKMVQNETVTTPAASVQIKVSDLSAGSYVLEVNSNTGTSDRITVAPIIIGE